MNVTNNVKGDHDMMTYFGLKYINTFEKGKKYSTFYISFHHSNKEKSINPIPYGPFPNLFPMGVGHDHTLQIQRQLKFCLLPSDLSCSQMDKALAL